MTFDNTHSVVLWKVAALIHEGWHFFLYENDNGSEFDRMLNWLSAAGDDVYVATDDDDENPAPGTRAVVLLKDKKRAAQFALAFQ